MKIKVVIPIYSIDLSKYEYKSLNQACTVLSKYSLVFMKPTSLDVSPILEKYPNIQTEEFDDKFFKDTIGYNQLMMLPEFYSRFLDSDYILIYQLDAYVFRDELEAWCEKGYDYIGAPWFEKPIYRYAYARWWRTVRRSWKKKKEKVLTEEEERQAQIINSVVAARTVNPVGNGGFSLRKVRSHYNTTIELKDKINFYIQNKHSRSPVFNEDIFWASEPDCFSYPSMEEALKFSFDKYPRICYKKNGRQLPFGCHGWYKKRTLWFWKWIIRG